MLFLYYFFLFYNLFCKIVLLIKRVNHIDRKKKEWQNVYFHILYTWKFLIVNVSNNIETSQAIQNTKQLPNAVPWKFFPNTPNISWEKTISFVGTITHHVQYQYWDIKLDIKLLGKFCNLCCTFFIFFFIKTKSWQPRDLRVL